PPLTSWHYDASAVKIPGKVEKPVLRSQCGNLRVNALLRCLCGEKYGCSLKTKKMTARVTTVRPERGYSAANYGASVVRVQKTLRRQIGQKYDVKKVR